jgi:SnoaL-like domain
VSAEPGGAPRAGWAHASGELDVVLPSAPAGRSTALDRSLVLERLACYAWALDERREDLLAECFTEAAVWEASIAGERRIGPFEGRKEIVASVPSLAGADAPQRRHMLVNALLESQGERDALALAYQIVFRGEGESVALETTGFCRFELARCEDGEWRIARLLAGYDVPPAFT